MKRSTHLLCTGLSLATMFFLLCISCEKPPPISSTIEEVVKHALNAPADSAKEFEVEGYYWNQGVPMLVTDLSLLQRNTAMPRSAYIEIGGPVVKLLEGKTEFEGAFVRIKGTVSRTVLDYGDLIIFRCPDLPEILIGRQPGVLLPTKSTFCDMFPTLCGAPVFQIKNKFALLYSGGIDRVHAWPRYWNDLRFMYSVLRNKYGYSDENIIVVYKDGVAESNEMPVHFAANPQGFEAAITQLRNRMTDSDDLFVFTTNHGGGNHRAGGHQNEWIADWGRLPDFNLDENQPDDWDEILFYYEANTEGISDDDFAEAINSVPHHQLIALLEPCFSGGFLFDMRRDENTVLMSACLEDEFSYGEISVDGVPFDFFCYFFTEALNRADPAGRALSTNPDANGDGQISMLEAFNYARMQDPAPETPMLEADGDGVGRNNPTLSDPDGWVASGAFL